MRGWLLCLVTVAVVSDVSGAGAGAARLVCYVENARATEGFTECTHLVYAGDARGDKLDALLKEYRKNNPRLKIVLRIAEIDKDLRKLLKSKHVQGLEIYDAHRSLNKTKVLQAVEEARSTLSSSGGGPLFLALPANPELLAKYYDLRVLVKKVDLVMVQTHALGVVKKMTYHPSRLSGMWDMMNTDSVVDLIVGLGVPASKIVISLPATAHKFTLLNETLSTPGSPTVEEEPKEIDQTEVCRLLQKGRWTLERDQDLSAPYAFKNTTWMSFEDSSSVDVKGKYARVRGLAGLALHDADRDLETPCGVSLKAALAKVLNQQSRAPRAAVLRSLEHEILSAPGRALDALQVSPYRITQVVDSDGVIHSIREDTRTEFSCSRQGYFVHPRSCARFYRCVKFDQLSPDYTVFEFDCPAGLAFDARYEVCVWPGSLPSATACPGSAEIAPVPRDRFLCPDREGYYADPENCRWFFACLDHGKAPLTAYEFRCPFGLGFDAEKLKCDWPWLVPACGNIGRYEAEAYGFSSATLTGATGFHGKTADAVNIAAHQSLVSGASLDNLVGIQSGFLTKDDTLDSNFIASQELASGAFGSGQSYEIGNDASISQGQGLAYQVGDANLGLVQPTKYINAPKYTSGSIILDDYRLPSTKTSHGKAYNIAQANIQNGGYTKGLNSYSGSIISSGNYQSSNYNYDDDNSGAYIHDPSGDYAEPYKHVDSPVVPYTHDDAGYRHNGEYNDYGSSTGQGNNGGKYVDNNDGQYVHDNSGSYIHTESTGGSYSSSYNADYSDSFNSNSGKYEGGVYRADGHIGAYNSDTTGQYHGTYSNSNTGNYLSNSKAYTGASHTLTAGAVNVGLVGKTTLVDAGYTDQLNYQQANAASKLVTGHEVIHETYPGHIPYVSQPAVSINHVGTNSQNLNEYSYVTTPTSSGIPTTATPFAVTASVPVTTYRTTYVPEAPKSTVKQLFGISQPAITYVQPTAIAVKQYVTPKVEITDYNQGLNYQYENNAFSSNQYDGSSSVSQSSSGKSVTSGYEYSKPSIKFEDGISFTTPAPIVSVSTYKPQGFGHGQQTVHKIESVGFEYSSPTPITEQPFKKLVAYTTGPSVTYSQASDANLPHSYSHQTIHKVESNAYAPAVESGYDFSKSDIRYESPKPVIQLTTVQPVVSSYQQPQVYSHQTLHKVDASQVKTYSEKESEIGYEYKKPAIKFEDAVKTYGYSTPAPIVVSTINPQSLEHQIIQKVETPQVQYLPVPSTTPQPAVVSTYQPQVFSHQTIHKVDASQVNVYSKNDGYEYQKPEVKFVEGIKTAYEYSTPAPIVSTYKPQSYNHQTIHKIDTPKVEITYQQTPVTVYENPLLKYTEKVIPETNVHHAYNTQAYSHQTIHKIEDSKLYTPSIKVAYESNVNYEEPTVKYTTAQPELAIQQVVSTYQPQVQSHQTLHNVEASKVNTYSGSTGYNYEAPSVKFEDGPNIIHEYSTPAPTVISTYKPQSYSHQTIHKVEAQKYIPVSSTPKVAVTYQQPSVSVYKNPILTYTEKVTPITYVKPTASVYTQTYQPIIHQHEVSHVSQPVKYESSAQQSYTSQNIQLNQEGYSYSQPEIQRNVETLNKGQSYSDANLVSHQFIQQSNDQYESGKDIVIVSSTPSTLAYEEHYSEYETPRKQQLYKAPEYIPPKTEYQQSYSVSSTLSPLAEQQSSIIHETDDEKYYKAVDNSPRYKSIHNSPLQQISYSTSHISQPKKESIHFSSFPGTTITTKYKQVAYESPEIQVGYKAEEYLPPVVSTPIVTSTYKPSTLSSASTTREYLPPSDIKYNEREYLPPKVENSYLPPKTAKPIVISTTQRPTYKYTQSTTEYSAPEYLPPADEKGSDIVNFENFDFNQQNTEEIIKNNPYQEQYSVSTLTPLRKPNLVVERAKSNLLGFGTVGPDAGLISPVTYTTAAPVVVSSTNTPYTYIESTTQYKAPEYLPPSDTRPEKIRPVPVHRQQNIVVETAKSHLLGFGTVGPDAGLVSPVTYTTAQPIISSTDSYSLRPKTVTSTLAPFNQEISEVPIRKTKPKVAVVTKINDFNPLLVRKLGAVCSCQSPVLILKGKRPNVQVQPDVIDYNNDYDDSDRGDISDNQWGQRSGNLQLSINSATPSPIISSTINPIIVPDDSYYQDYQEPNNYVAAVTPKINELYSENFESSTPIVVSSTEKTVRIRPRVKAVTIAPTYKTVLLNQEAASNTEVKEAESADSIINSQSFDRYGPGGWRSRDETLQGTVDCQRAGLFRHPKQCNKFYACRWDCTKQRFTLHVFNCPVQLTFDPNMGACNWPSQGPACQGDTLLTNTL